MLKQDIKALLDRVALPKSNAGITVPSPTLNSWDYYVNAPCNGYVYLLAYNCSAICLTNTSTGVMHYFRPIGVAMSDLANSIAVKKGDRINLYVGGDAGSIGKTWCSFIPFEGQ